MDESPQSEETQSRLELHRDGERLRLVYGGRVIVEHTPKRPFLSVGSGRVRYSDSRGHYTISPLKVARRGCPLVTAREDARGEGERRAVLLVTPEGAAVRFAETADHLEVTFPHCEPDISNIWISLPVDPGEHFYGGGQQYSRLDLKGSRVPIWVQEQGIGRGKDAISWLARLRFGAGGHWYSTYFPQPTFVSSASWFCHTDLTRYAELDFSGGDRVTIHAWEVPDRIVFGVHDTLEETVRGVGRLLGTGPKLPDWVYSGMWLGVQGGSDEVRRKIERAENAGIRLSGAWAQDWEGIRITSFGRQLMWDWSYDRTLYPDFPDLISELGGRGIRMLGYINPFLAIEGELYREASEKGYCVQDPRGGDYMITITTFPAALIDLTNPDAVSWIKGVIKENMLGVGLSGWMADYGEYLPTDAVLYSGESSESFHNRYPAEWARVNREAVEEAGALGEAVFFMRAGYTGTSRYSLGAWAGDQLVNWSPNDGLPTVIPAALSSGFSGTGVHHSDIGGFTTLAWIRRSKELLLRWAEQAAFTPIMRSHEGNRPGDNWQFDSDAETLAHLARMTRVYTQLAPYHAHVVETYARTGLPAMRHPALHYGTDETAHRQRYQYLYGRDLLVAPVVKKNTDSWPVYLPEDEWVHLWSGQPASPGWRTETAPCGRPPVYYRRGSEFAGLFASLAEDA
ncbi:MAG: alpha-glucosidase [Spirochaetes bacterium]|nr:alpha-glucosidase [Spirochaetota bacterium]